MFRTDKLQCMHSWLGGFLPPTLFVVGLIAPSGIRRLKTVHTCSIIRDCILFEYLIKALGRSCLKPDFTDEMELVLSVILIQGVVVAQRLGLAVHGGSWGFGRGCCPCCGGYRGRALLFSFLAFTFFFTFCFVAVILKERPLNSWVVYGCKHGTACSSNLVELPLLYHWRLVMGGGGC